MDPLLWSIFLLTLALALVVLELFVPSGGVLGFLAAAAAVASIVVAFTAGPRQGMIMLVVTTLLVPIVLVSAIRWWPHTPIGRLILIHRPENPDDVLPDTEEYRGLKPLVGKLGVAKSKMLPSGSVTIDGKTHDAVSEGMPIEPGQTIRVVSVRTNRLVVRPSSEPPPEAQPAAALAADDPLSQPIEAMGLEGLDEPLA
jgi:membrane-bound serine protease (ClpP class)